MSEVVPALTPEEWATWREHGYVMHGGPSGGLAGGQHIRLATFASRKRRASGEDGIYMAVVPVDLPEEKHALAALCLHDQPFGFTRAMVEAIRACVGAADTPWDRGGAPPGVVTLARQTADRIEALLPPEEP